MYRRLLGVFSLSLGLWIAGCATAPPRFVPNGVYTPRPPKPPDQVTLYYFERDVPYKYEELGRIFLVLDPGYLNDPAAQIAAIRAKSGEIGADAVILAPSYANYSSGYYTGGRRGGAGENYTYGGTLYSGIAIVKK